MDSYSKAAREWTMKIQEVLLRAMARKITWFQAAEILGFSDRHVRRIRPSSTPSARVCRMKAQLRPRPISVLRQAPAFCVSWVSSQAPFPRRVTCSQHPPHIKPHPIFNRTASSHSGIRLPHHLSPLNAIQIP